MTYPMHSSSLPSRRATRISLAPLRRSPPCRSRPALGIAKLLPAFLLTLGLTSPARAAWQPATNLNLRADATFKEAFDSNVYLQDHEPDLTRFPKAVRPFQESFVTSITPRLGLDYRPAPAFGLALSYAPEVTFYHAEPTEDNVAHRGLVNFSGNVRELPWEMVNSFTWIDGSDEGVYFGAPGGAPAIGGIPIRDRRAAFIYRGSFRVTYAKEKWLFRPVANGYLQDFFIEQRTDPGYANFVDRSDINGGFDVGYQAMPKLYVLAGYRYGFQDEGELITTPHRFDNQYQRLLFGLEGQPRPWLKVGISVGPDFRNFVALTAPGFDDHHTTIYIDSVVSLLPTPNDTIVLTARRYEQPAFASCSAYEDITYDFAWKHRFGDRFSGSAGFRIYIGDWLDPVQREDWIYTPSGALTYTHDQHLSAELAYSYDWVDSKVPHTVGREFTRHLVSLALRYSF